MTAGLFMFIDGEWERLPVIDWRVTRGVSGDLAGNSSPGSATFTIQNPGDRYNPRNAAGDLYGLLVDGVPLWCGVNTDGTIDDDKTVYGVFAGYLTDIEPMPEGGATASPTVVITGADPLEWMGRQPVRLADSRTRSQADLRADVLDAIGWPFLTDLPAEPTTLVLSGADGFAANVLDALNAASGTRHYIRPADTSADFCTYVAVRRTSLLDAATVASLDAGSDHLTGTSGWRLSADGVINQQRASIEPIIFSALRDVWVGEVLPTVVTGTPYEVLTDFLDYVDGPVVDVAYTGAALTTTLEPFGQTAKLTLTSAGTSVVTHLAIQGHAAVRAPAVVAVHDDTASQTGRGIRAGSPITGDLAGTLTAASGLAAHIVYRFPEPLARPTVSVVNWLPDQYQRDLLQLVAVTVAELALSGGVYEIVGLTHDGQLAVADDDGTPLAILHTTTLVLQESREQTDPGWFTTDVSESDGTDVLAY